MVLPSPAPSRARLQAEQRALAAELARRERLPRAVAAYEATLSEWQRRIVYSQARRITVHAGRRTGKTYGPVIGRALRLATEHPGATVPVFERTTTCNSAQVFWKGLVDLNEQFQLEAKFHTTLMRCRLTNRSTIIVMGADTLEACDKARGDAYPGALVDEAGTLRPHVLKYLLDDVLDAALLDFRGSLLLSGTPVPRFEDNPFYEACESPALAEAWERHHSTFLENDALPKGMERATPEQRRAARLAEFNAMLVRRGIGADDPSVQREWLGKWVRDANGLVYRLAAHNHAGLEPPDFAEGGWKFGLGIDLGYEDPTAFVVLAWRRGDPTVWVVESYQQGHLIPSQVCAHVDRLRGRYRFQFIVADSGGYGKGPVEELRAQGVPCEAASKRGKEGHIYVANGDLQSGAVRIVEPSNRELVADLYGLRKDEDGKEHKQDANHLPDAFLYGLMRLRGRLRDFGDREPRDEEARAARLRADEEAAEAAAEAAHARARGRRGGRSALDEALAQLGRS